MKEKYENYNMDKSMARNIGLGLSCPDWLPKAMASFISGEIIEEIRIKYKISHEDVEMMNKMSADRAALFLRMQKSDRPETMKALALYASGDIGSVDIEEDTEDICLLTELFDVCEDIIRKSESNEELRKLLQCDS